MTSSAPPQHAAAVEFLAARWPAEGGRHKAYLHLIGGLLRSRVPTDQVEAIVSDLAEATGDDATTERLADVASTAQKLKANKPVTGWPRLAEVLGEDGQQIVRQFKVLLGLTIDLKQLAEEKGLPVEFLEGLGLHDLPTGGVGIPYCDPTGKTIVKSRTALKAKEGSLWPKGTPVQAYGEHCIDDAVKAGYQALFEGESDCWAMWHHSLPALGLPGADTVARTLCNGHVAPFRYLFVHQEPDAGGETFVKNVAQRLAALGWCGEAKVVRLPEGIKDPAELHKDDPERFKERWQDAVANARPLAIHTAGPVPATPAAPPRAEPSWPDPLGEEAMHGLAGDIVRVIEPASEADPVALLVQLLIGFGNLVGRTACCRVEADQHFGNEFAVLVGRTSKARKGTSWGRIRALLQAAEEEWAEQRVQTGLSSGEGLIWGVRDPVMKRERVKERGEPVRYEEVEADPGITDKRLLIVEPEFANVLKQTERQGNTLSAVLRQAWECGDLRTLTKNSPTKATGAHVSLLGHITMEELRRYLSTTEAANGFGNRFLWLCVRRSKELPEGGHLEPATLADLQARLAGALLSARQVSEVRRDGEAREIWRELYGQLSADRPGLSGALLGRAEAHVLRFSLLYALLDCSAEIGACHLMAALAVWHYCEQSVRHLFGDALGDPVADELMRLLRAAPDGMTRWEMTNALGRNVPSDRIGKALALLAEHGHARMCPRQPEGRGRPEERWLAV